MGWMAVKQESPASTREKAAEPPLDLVLEKIR